MASDLLASRSTLQVHERTTTHGERPPPQTTKDGLKAPNKADAAGCFEEKNTSEAIHENLAGTAKASEPVCLVKLVEMDGVCSPSPVHHHNFKHYLVQTQLLRDDDMRLSGRISHPLLVLCPFDAWHARCV